MTNQTPVEYCRHCGKEVRPCGCRPKCLLKGYVHLNRICDQEHFCFDAVVSAKSSLHFQVAEPADPPQQLNTLKVTVTKGGCSGTIATADLPTTTWFDQAGYVKAGTQMEDARGQALWEAAKAICSRCAIDGRPKDGKIETYSGEARGYLHYYDNGEVSECEAHEIHEMLAKIPKTQMEERKPICTLCFGVRESEFHTDDENLIENGDRDLHKFQPQGESANREPQACPMKELSSMSQAASLDFAIDRVIENLDVLDAFAVQSLRNKFKASECELQELRAQHEQLTAFSLLQKECVIAAEEMYGTCLGAYPNSSETARTEACRKFLQLNDAVGRHPLDDKFLGMTDWKDIAASLRGLVGRICETVSEIGWCSICGRTDCGKNPLVHKPTCLISEAEAAIKEPHNG